MITILHTIVLLILIVYIIWLEHRLRGVEAGATVLKEVNALELKMIDNVNERVGMNRKQIEDINKCILEQARVIDNIWEDEDEILSHYYDIYDDDYDKEVAKLNEELKYERTHSDVIKMWHMNEKEGD